MAFPAKLDGLLKVVCDIKKTLYRLQNTTQPINRLPAEVLGHIFFFLPTRRAYPILNTSTTNVLDVKPLLPALSVCRLWREVARGASFLWSTVIRLEADNGYGATLPQDYLHLCPARPIYVVSRCNGSPKWLPRLLRAQETRIRELYVTLDWVSNVDASAILQLSLPSLERCTVRGDGKDDVSYDESASPMAIFPNSNTLQALRLRCVRFVPSTAFPALTTLHLTKLEGVRLVDLLSFLAGAPALRNLELCRVAPTERDGTNLSGWKYGRVQLTNLGRLFVEDDIIVKPPEPERPNALAQYQYRLLANLSIPPACEHTVCPVIGTAHVSNLLAQLWPSSADRCATQARILPLPDSARKGPKRIVVRLNGEGGLDASFRVVEQYDFPGSTPRTRFFDALSTGSAFEHIRKVWIEDGMEWLCVDLPCILTALPCVESIIITSYIPPDPRKAFFEALAVSPDGALSAPFLSTLVLDLGSGIGESHEIGDVGVDGVYETQRSRAAAGYPLRRLIHVLPRGAAPPVNISREYNADGVLVRKEHLRVVLRELEEEWRRTGPTKIIRPSASVHTGNADSV